MDQQSQKPSRKTWQMAAIIAAGILVIGGVSYVSYYWWQKSVEKVSQNVSLFALPDETTGWQLFNEENNGVSIGVLPNFKYPQNWYTANIAGGQKVEIIFSDGGDNIGAKINVVSLVSNECRFAVLFMGSDNFYETTKINSKKTEDNQKTCDSIITQLEKQVLITSGNFSDWQRYKNEQGSSALRNTQRKAAIFGIVDALEKYNQEKKVYPIGRMNSVIRNGIFSSDQNINVLIPKYMSQPRLDPINKDPFFYIYQSKDGSYSLFARLEDDKKGGDAGLYFCIDKSIESSPITVTVEQFTKAGCKNEISGQIGRMEPTAIISLLRQIETSLFLYKDQYNYFPQKLIDLSPGFISNEQLFRDSEVYYAYYPVQKPTRFHLGAKLPDGFSSLKSDIDFNSKLADYVNGFDGTDPVYDLIETL